MLLLWLACSTPAPSPGSAAPGLAAPEGAAPVIPRPAVTARFVQASSLNVRSEPLPDAPVRARLSVNTEVAVLEVRGAWSRVRTPDGGSGWCAGSFLGDAPLTLDQAIAQARDGATDAERLAGWQRAGALAPEDPAVLEGLEAAYRAAGDPSAADWVARVRAGEGTPWERWFTPAQRAEVDGITAGLGAVATPEALGALHARAMTAAGALSEGINQHVDVQAGDDPSGWLRERVPWAEMSVYAEGTWAQLDLDARVWTEAAERTPGRQDDTFVKLLVDGWGHANPDGWPVWLERTWDYGGCSRLGTGVHHRLLQTSDGLRVPPFADTVARVRGELLADIQGLSEFPWCDPASGPTDPERLRAEVQAILDGVELSAEERTLVQARLTEGFAPR